MKFFRIIHLGKWLSTLALLWIAAGGAFAAGKSCHRGFVVFAGEDQRGKVVFAMETTRSQGNWWDWTQASQAVWLYEEAVGWAKLKKPYGHAFRGSDERRIGGEWECQLFQGYQPKMAIHSSENGIHLNLQADQVAVKGKSRDGQIVVANGTGLMTWKSRRLKGRVFMRDAVHMGQSASDLYLKAAKGSRLESAYVSVGNRGMMSLLRTNDPAFANLSNGKGLVLQLDTLNGLVEDLQMEATAYKRLGLFEYPTEWQGTFSVDGRQGMFKLSTFDTQTTEYLLIGGNRLGWAKGFLCFDGESHAVFGLTEVRGSFQGRKEIEEDESKSRPVQETQPGTSWDALLH